MATQFPWRYIKDLPKGAQEQIRRNFDELALAIDNIPSVYTVVADDGSGDFTSIKEAIEATSNGVNNEAGTAIFVKPGTYNDGGDGQVNLNGPKRVWVFASPPPHFGLTTATQSWTYDGFVCTTGTAHVTLIGVAPNSGATEDWLNGAGTIYLHLDRVRGGSGRGVFGSTGSHHFRATDCEISATVLFTASTGGTVPASVICDNSDISITTAASTPPVLSVLGLFRIIGGDLSHQASLTASASGGSGGEFIIANSHLSGGGTITSAFDVFTVTGVTTDEDTSGVDFVIDGVSGSRFAMVAMSGNAMHGCDITTGNNCRVSIQGAYRTLTIGSTAGSYFVELDNVSASTCITIQNTSGGGDSNMVVAALRQVGGGSSRNVLINSSCNNNVVIYTVSGSAALADSDSGTGNLINSLPGAPTGPAGGDLGGTYPDPTVDDDSHNHTAATVTLDLPELGDVDDAMTPGSGDVLTYDGAEWIAAAPASPSFTDDFGDGAATSFNHDHNLGTLAVVVEFYVTSTGVQVYPDTLTHSTTNRVISTWDVAPTSNELTVVVKA